MSICVDAFFVDSRYACSHAIDRGAVRLYDKTVI